MDNNLFIANGLSNALIIPSTPPTVAHPPQTIIPPTPPTVACPPQTIVPPTPPTVAHLPQTEESDLQPYAHVVDFGKKHKKREKENNGLKHFQYYLKHERKCNWKVDEVPLDKLTQDLFGGFGTYLSEHAHQYCDPSRARISYSTASGYISSTKMHYINKYRDFDPPTVFSKFHWSQILKNILGVFVDRHKGTGDLLVKPKEAATDGDVKTMATVCIWIANPESAEFWHLNNSMTQCSGRGSEIACSRHDCVTVGSLDEVNVKYNVLQHRCNRFKTGVLQDLDVFPHKESWEMCYYFSGAYNLIMQNGYGGDFVYPKFGEKALNENEHEKKNSLVSKLWTDAFKTVVAYYYEHYQDIMETYEDFELNLKLGAHSGKKRGLEQMNDSILNPISLIFRGGWEIRNVHSLFDYIFQKKAQDIEAGKSGAGWKFKYGNSIYGGYPADLVDISDPPETVSKRSEILQ